MGTQTKHIQDYYLPKSHYLQMASLKSNEFDAMLIKYPELTPNDQGYPLFQFMKCVMMEMRYYRDKESSEQKVDLENLNNQFVKEKILTQAILNRNKAGVLIPKPEAETRIKVTLASIAAAIEAAIQLIAEDDGGNIRANVEKYTPYFRESYGILYDGCNNITWSDHGEAESLYKRMKKLAEEDPEFVELHQELYHGKG